MEYGNGNTNQLIWRETENRYHNEQLDVTPDNPNVNISILSNYVKENSKVLDLGCGEGKFGKLLEDKNCYLVGVDLDEKAIEYAKINYGYHETYLFNVEQKDSIPQEFEKYTIEKFDYIALLDVLEHVINPTAVIENLLPYLKDGGQILLSVPNVNNADIFMNLLRDHFNYRAAGVLDNTHTKYFTKRSFIEWIKELNDFYDWTMDCEYIGSIFAFTDYMEEVKTKLPALYAFVQMNPYFHVMQHLFVVTYQPNKVTPDKLNALFDEPQIDLTKILNDMLANSSVAAKKMKQIDIIPNERKLLEDRFMVCQKGWDECSESLQKSREYIQKKEGEIESLTNYVKKLENDIQELKQAISGFEVECSQKDNCIIELEGKNATLENKNIALVTELRELSEQSLWERIFKRR